MRVANPPSSRPLMIYDGECDFCSRWILRWRRVTGARVDYAASRDAASRFPEIPQELFEQAACLIGTDGLVSSGGEAVIRSLACRPAFRWLLWIYLRAAGVRRVVDASYRMIARKHHCRGARRGTGFQPASGDGQDGRPT